MLRQDQGGYYGGHEDCSFQVDDFFSHDCTGDEHNVIKHDEASNYPQEAEDDGDDEVEVLEDARLDFEFMDKRPSPAGEVVNEGLYSPFEMH
ncbi:hypothetical protein ACP70R_024998 [Stipagrostis hirtigluma subsp. patula]